MLLENNNIRLRALEPEDLDFLHSMENDTEQWHTTNTVSPYSRYELKQYIASSPRDIYTQGLLKLIIERKSDGEPIGIIDLFDFDQHNSRLETGVAIKEAFRRSGYALQALELARDYAFNFLHLHQLYCHIPVTNSASEALFIKAGYEKTALLRSWLKTGEDYIDVQVMQLTSNY